MSETADTPARRRFGQRSRLQEVTTAHLYTGRNLLTGDDKEGKEGIILIYPFSHWRRGTLGLDI